MALRIRSSRALASLAMALICGLSLGQTRRALVIGNDSYPGNRLRNAKNDAQAVQTVLRNLGYVTSLFLDVDRKQLVEHIGSFIETINAGDTAVLYYSGHGFQVNGENYLVPIDFQAGSTREAQEEGYSLSRILDQFSEHGASTRIIILDACRNNPFPGTRAVAGGWAPVSTSSGTFVAFGTSPGATASDGIGRKHGAFTDSLLRYLGTSDLEIDEMFRRVREDTIRSSGGEQVPWVASSLIGEFHMKPGLDSGEAHRFSADLAQLQVLSEPRQSSAGGRNLQESEEGQIQEAASLVRGERLSDAVTILKKVLELNPYSAVALRLLGLIFHLTGQDFEALQAFDRAIALPSEDGTTWAYKCALENLLGTNTALVDCEAAARDKPTSQTYFTLAAAYYARSQDGQAITNLDKSLSLGPTDLAYKLRNAITSRTDLPRPH